MAEHRRYGKNTMRDPVITHMHQFSLFMKSTATAVIIAFGMLILTPTVDTETGAGAYEISGGNNGHYLSTEEIERIRAECNEDPSAGIALIGAVIYLTMIASAIQSFAVELAAGCHPITRNK